MAEPQARIGKPILIRGLTYPTLGALTLLAKQRRKTRNGLIVETLTALATGALMPSQAHANHPDDHGEDLTVLITKHGLEKALAIEASRAIPPTVELAMPEPVVVPKRALCTACGQRGVLGTTAKCGPCHRQDHEAARAAASNAPPTGEPA